MGNTNLSTTICLLWLLTLTNLYTPIDICILAHTSLPTVITRISYNVLTNTNMYSAIYEHLLPTTKLYTAMHKDMH